MRHNLFDVVFKFLRGGVSAFSRTSHETAPTHLSDDDTAKLLKEFGAAMRALDTTSKGRGALTPFEVHMARHSTPEFPKNNSAWIECVLSALTDLGEEIRSLVPESTITTSVERGEVGGVKTFKGHLSWDLDTTDPLVYTISISLLRDGFIYVKDEDSYVITVRAIE